LTQAFFAVLLEKQYLGEADRQRGRLRAFLLTAVKHFLANERDREHALKRGGNEVAISIDSDKVEEWYARQAIEQRTPEHLFERRWAVALLEQVMAKLRAEFTGMGKAEYFAKLSVFLNGDPGSNGYQALAIELGASAGALRIAVHRMRRKYRDLLRAEIAETVSTPEAIDDEIRFLVSTLTS
jgi:RNA polymerase sigma-70 factor (ECF subfamily)